MFCRNCGKPIPEDARFCMYCGTPVETATSEIEDQDVATEVLPEAENVYQTEPEAEATQPDDMFGGSDEVQEPEPEPVKKERPVFDEINWNVEEYPDSETVTKTEDVDFNWNANPADIPDPVRRRDYHDEPDPVTDFFKEGAEPEAEPVKEESFSGFTAPAADIIQPVDDIDIKLDSVIKGEEAVPAPDLFGDKPETEDLSAAERIDKFYTFNRKNEEFQQLLNREYEKVRSGGAIGDELSRAGAIADERFEARETHEPQTMEELFECLTWKQLGLHGKPVVIVNTNGYYDHVIAALDRMVTERFMQPVHRNRMFAVVSSPEQVLPAIYGATEWGEHMRNQARTV